MTFLERLPLSPDTRVLAAQFIRYGITGGFVTLLGVAGYSLVASQLHWPPLLATFLAYVISGTTGYVLHSRFSFRGHGRRDNLLRTGGRFFLGSLVSYGLNSLFVWILTGPLAGPWWWPVPVMIFVTPVIVFVLNRKWVFA